MLRKNVDAAALCRSQRNDKFTQRWWKFIQNLVSKSGINYLAKERKQQDGEDFVLDYRIKY